MSTERTLDAMAGYQPKPFVSDGGHHHVRVEVVKQDERGRDLHPEEQRYRLVVDNLILGEFYDLYVANGIGQALASCLPAGLKTRAALQFAIRHVLQLKSLRFVLVDILETAQERYQSRSEDPMEADVFECRKIARVLSEELILLRAL